MQTVAGIFLISSVAVFADEPGNPGFEDDNFDIAPWTVIDEASTNCSGSGYVVTGGDPTEGVNYGAVGCYGNVGSGGSSDGPALKSETFFAASGEEFSVDWRVWAGGGFGPGCGGDPTSGDAGYGIGSLVDALTDTPVAYFFDTSGAPTDVCNPVPWNLGATATAPLDGDYYVLFRVGSADATGGTVIGASLDIDNFQSLNTPPDCSEAAASPDWLWPPNHKAHDIEITGVTDPDGDAFVIEVTSIRQDEPTNSYDDGDTCPDASGVGTDGATVLAERVGGEFGSEGDGRFYWIYFTATDDYGATCDGLVKVNVPHSVQETGTDGGPLFDSTQCP